MQVDVEILTASPMANGFFGAKGVSGWIPTAYSLLEAATWRRLTRAWARGPAPGRAASKRLLEYARPRLGVPRKGHLVRSPLVPDIAILCVPQHDCLASFHINGTKADGCARMLVAFSEFACGLRRMWGLPAGTRRRGRTCRSRRRWAAPTTATAPSCATWRRTSCSSPATRACGRCATAPTYSHLAVQGSGIAPDLCEMYLDMCFLWGLTGRAEFAVWIW